ncbi:hypothetical protein E0L36_17400 [Streptomyces sp. AJS327]|uniref:hypothetical protein n=1 Tax=Streptomyces sp. AJS327 TaxID=2545265 RepID=UPI0015E03A38|nr:hypothetical protein [Streptomyces sp. AJS327]MBA0052597.1 hypothetical protein [Streptomyces sp. AJS327]
MSDEARDEAAPLPPGAPAREVWHGRAGNRLQWPLAMLGVGCLALGIALAVSAAWSGGVAPLVMSVVGCVAAGLLALFGTLSFVKVSVLVDGESLLVRCGHLGLPRRSIPLREVVDVEMTPVVTPRHWGGWGYRWRPGMGTAIVVRQGEGIVVRLADGKVFTVTVDDAASAVRAIRGWLPRVADAGD